MLYGDGAWRAVTEGDAFDLHDDITQSATIADTDRLLFSDEGSGGDPMRYTTAASLANYMQGEVELNANTITAGTLNSARVAVITSQAAYDLLTPNANTIYLITS